MKWWIMGLSLATAGLLAGCTDTPPPGVDPTAWRAALAECRQQARIVFGGPPIGGVGTHDAMVHDTNWEVVDPCMVAMGYPPPPD